MTDTVEFARSIDVTDLEEGDRLDEKIAADESERHSLAQRFDVDAIISLEAAVIISRRGRQVVVDGLFAVDLRQTCVITLEPIETRIDEELHVVFDPDVRPSGEFDETIDLNVGSEDPPEPMVDERFDLGEAVAERLGLAIDPYPRKPGAVLDERYTDKESLEPANPFEALKSLKFDT
ncbi:MAG: phosphodiesterase [Rhodospirillaceae bacterium]|nr:phosphodiesterase [Rhodospirillaceae bacterium]|tara:strand:- start:6721 stop:7254 length:534 start_codon:yes stop_codon:yes gene_type:complete